MDKEGNNNEAQPIKISYHERIKRQIESRQDLYYKKFGMVSEEGYFLPISICEQEVERAQLILSDQGKTGEAKMVSYSEYPTLLGGFEIDVDGRRFSLPRDGFYKPEDDYLSVEVNNMVVSVLQKEKWPSNFPFEMTPEIEIVLNDIDSNSLIDGTRDLAIFLQLGDKNFTEKRSYLKRITIEKALGDFGVDSVDDLKIILHSIGLEIINTSDRLSDINNADTEIDEIFEAIKKSQAKPYVRRRWLHGAL